MEIFNNLIFKEIPNYDGYFAGNDGNIYSCWTKEGKNSKIIINKIHVLKPSLQSNKKYLFVIIKNNNKIRIAQRVHRLICMAFHGLPPTSKHTTSHLNGQNFDNRPENLKWETLSENDKHKVEHKTDDRGYHNSRAKINKEQLDAIRKLLNIGKFTHKEIGEKFNLNRIFITKIANDYRYKGV